MFFTCFSLSSEKIQGNNSKKKKKQKTRSLKIQFQFTRCLRHSTFLKLPLPLSLSLLTGYLNSGPYQFAILLIFIFTVVVLISCIGSFIIFRQWAPIIKIRSLLRTLTMLYEETYIAMWFNSREGSLIKKIIKKAMSNENCMDKTGIEGNLKI